MPSAVRLFASCRRPCHVLLALAFALTAPLVCAEARPLASVKAPPNMKQDLETLQRYADEVNRRSDNRSAAPPAAAPAATTTPATAPTASVERDPFEVSPQLRESGLRARTGGGLGDNGALNRTLRIRAMARGPEGGIAQIEAGKDVITVRDGDELVVDGIRYTVHIERDSLVLRGAGAPQFKMLVR
jgi:hypothetical protein